MNQYKKVYPSALKFIKTASGIKVGYPEAIIKKRSPDLWALKYLLDQGLYNLDKINVINLSGIDKTMALRLYFLSEVFYKVKFSAKDDFESQAKDIIENIDKRYKTYSRNFKKRGTKSYPESLLETDVWENLENYFDKEFVKSKYGIRQFPANIFDNDISERKRITRKFWIDILTVNKLNQLSVIELKAGSNASLDLLAQAIDYGIYCYIFKKHISNCWFNDNKSIIENKIAIYCIAENFHPALTDDEGIKSLIKPNKFLDIIFIAIKVEKNKVKSHEVIFDTRRLCS